MAADETVTLRVVNTGTLPHDFLLDDAALQVEHSAEMTAAGGKMPDDDHHLTVPPGEVMYGCHTPGHFEAGMVGTVTVK